jgi:DNA-binding Lrp family transcriptional regulator
MDKPDIALIRELERGLPLVPAPFAEIGRRLDLSEQEVMERVRRLKEAGIIRKVRARIDQRKLGITANALVAWKPPEPCGDRFGGLLAAFPAVTHCYERRPVPGRWEYTHYSVHHGTSREGVLAEVRAVAETCGCPEYTVLFSTREFKRVPNVRIGGNGVLNGGGP